MPKVDVIDLNNQKVGEVELSDAVFGAEVNQDLLYESVRHYLAGTRAGTHKVKTRHEVAGSGKKLWKQKGTGRARLRARRLPLPHPPPRTVCRRGRDRCASGADPGGRGRGG